MSLRTSLAALALIFAAPLASWAQTPTGVWEGDLRRGDAAMPIRLTITRDGGAVSGALDLPNLVYAEEPAALSERADGVVVATLPFGLGDFPLQRGGNRLAGRQGEFEISLRPGAPAPYIHEFITIPIEGGSYRGELYTPADLRRPRGAIIIAGGASARGERLDWSTRSWCDFYARQGMHCLVFPRRLDIVDGEISSMVQDVADLRAAVHLMAARPLVDRGRIGVFAASRGVWLAVRAAAQDHAIRFLILSAAPATTPSEQAVSSLVYRLRAAGRSDADVANAVAYSRLYFSVAHTGRGWEALADAASRKAAEPWGALVSQPRHLGDLDWWRVNGEFDPTRDYAALRIPVFAYWGENDPIVPAAYHRGLLEGLMPDNAELTTAVFPRGDHRGEQPGGEYDDGRWHWFGMADGLLDSISGWLAERGYSSPARRRRR
ncbi:MAG TPA: hypothetical protein VEF55_11360 [Candidatus Binatia bacterium]|nr:hypothetical protein [Candidatus Binatia bacterium]